MFSSISRIFFGASEDPAAPSYLASVEEDSNFDTKSDDGEWVYVVKGDKQSAPVALGSSFSSLSSQLEQMVENDVQPIIVTVMKVSKKSKKNKKNKKEMKRSRGEKKSVRANRTIQATVASRDQQRAAKAKEFKAFRCNKKSMDRHNKCMSVSKGKFRHRGGKV